MTSTEELREIITPRENRYGLYVSPTIRHHAELKAVHREVAAYMAHLSRLKGHAFCSNKHLAEHFGVDARTVRRWLQKLEICGIANRVMTITSTAGFQRKVFLSPVVLEEYGIDHKAFKGFFFIEPEPLMTKDERRQSIKDSLHENRRYLRSIQKRNARYKRARKLRLNRRKSSTSVVICRGEDKNVRNSKYSLKKNISPFPLSKNNGEQVPASAGSYFSLSILKGEALGDEKSPSRDSSTPIAREGASLQSEIENEHACVSPPEVSYGDQRKQLGAWITLSFRDPRHRWLTLSLLEKNGLLPREHTVVALGSPDEGIVVRKDCKRNAEHHC